MTEDKLRPDFEAALRAQVERVEREGDRGHLLGDVVRDLELENAADACLAAGDYDDFETIDDFILDLERIMGETC